MAPAAVEAGSRGILQCTHMHTNGCICNHIGTHARQRSDLPLLCLSLDLHLSSRLWNLGFSVDTSLTASEGGRGTFEGPTPTSCVSPKPQHQHSLVFSRKDLLTGRFFQSRKLAH